MVAEFRSDSVGTVETGELTAHCHWALVISGLRLQVQCTPHGFHKFPHGRFLNCTDRPLPTPQTVSTSVHNTRVTCCPGTMALQTRLKQPRKLFSLILLQDCEAFFDIFRVRLITVPDRAALEEFAPGPDFHAGFERCAQSTPPHVRAPFCRAPKWHRRCRLAAVCARVGLTVPPLPFGGYADLQDGGWLAAHLFAQRGVRARRPTPAFRPLSLCKRVFVRAQWSVHGPRHGVLPYQGGRGDEA